MLVPSGRADAAGLTTVDLNKLIDSPPGNPRPTWELSDGAIDRSVRRLRQVSRFQQTFDAKSCNG